MKKIIVTIIVAFGILGASYAQDCIGITKTGKPCRISAMKDTKYCHIHNPNATRCGFIKANGEPCRIITHTAGQLCHIHRKLKAESK